MTKYKTLKYYDLIFYIIWNIKPFIQYNGTIIVFFLIWASRHAVNMWRQFIRYLNTCELYNNETMSKLHGVENKAWVRDMNKVEGGGWWCGACIVCTLLPNCSGSWKIFKFFRRVGVL